jgi:hypothetical protein
MRNHSTTLLAAGLCAAILCSCDPGDDPAPLARTGAALATSSATIIDFEDVAAGTMLSTEYAARGVLFLNGGHVREELTGAHSGTHVLRSARPTTEFDLEPLRVSFTSPQARVKFYVGQDWDGEQAIVRAFDGAGNQVAQDGPRPVAPGFTTPFEVHTSTATITSFTLDVVSETGGRKLLDDLEIDGQPPLPLPTTPPRVYLTAPVHLSQLDSRTVQVQGTTTGEQIVSATVTITRNLPGGSNLPPTIEVPLTLTSTGPNRYSFAREVELGTGEMRIYANVKNTAGLVGSSGALVVNLPQAIRDRMAAEGGTAVLGALRWGNSEMGDADCKYEVFNRAALASLRGGPVYMVKGTMFQLWISYKAGSSAYPRLGCPLGEETVVRTSDTGAAEGWAQDFQGGRLYFSSATHGHVVSRRFAGYLDRLAEISGRSVDEVVGLPIEDARSDADPFHGDTFELQRFRRKGVPVDTTLELRGNPVRLWVERQGGDGSAFLYDQHIDVHTATQVQSYLCLTDGGLPSDTPDPNVPQPCTVHIDPPPTEVPYPFADSICDGKFGAGDVLDDYLHNSPNPEWAAIGDQYRQTPYMGIVTSVEDSDHDLPWTHEHMGEPCDWHEDTIKWALIFGQLEIALPLITEVVAKALAGEDFCPSDFNIHVRPLPGYVHIVSPDENLHPRSNMEIEIERAFMDTPPDWMKPVAGDLVFLAGRWIVDCGHDHPFHTEIHPPSVLARIRQLNISENPARRASIQANIWVNAFYSGQPVDLDVYPLPRPSPTAVLYAITPTGAGRNVTVSSEILENNRVHVHIEGPTHHGGVTDLGEMKWDDDGGPAFVGQWELYWIDYPPAP